MEKCQSSVNTHGIHLRKCHGLPLNKPQNCFISALTTWSSVKHAAGSLTVLPADSAAWQQQREAWLQQPNMEETAATAPASRLPCAHTCQSLRRHTMDVVISPLAQRRAWSAPLATLSHINSLRSPGRVTGEWPEPKRYQTPNSGGERPAG